jgi:hypothetical protein
LDLSELFEENKKFILGVAGAAVVFFIADRIVSDDAEATTRKADAIVRDLQRESYPVAADTQKAARLKKELEARLAESTKRLAYAPDEGFDVAPSARDADLQYNALFRRVREEVVDGAAAYDIDVDPTLGLPEVSPSQPDEISRYANALDVVRRVSLLAIDAGVRSIGPITVSKGSIGRFRSSESFLEELEITVRITGGMSSVGEVVEALSRPDSLVPIQSATLSLESEKRGPATGVSAELRLTALHVSPDKPLDAGKPRGGRR